MPIVPPRLDDRHYEDLVEEMLARVPAHTPEWVPQVGDPGRTMVELFAWLADAILYRANLIPERQRLAFLRLIGQQMRPAAASTGLVALRLNEPEAIDSVQLARGATISGPIDFEALSEITLMPVVGECYYKRPLNEKEEAELSEILDGLRDFHGIQGNLQGYTTESIFVEGAPEKQALDLIQDTVDDSLWIALLAPTPAAVPAIRQTLSGEISGQQQLINIGLAPAVEIPDALEGISVGGNLPHVWEISTPDLADDQPVYTLLESVADTTQDLTQRGISRLAMPVSSALFGVLEGDVRVDANAGVGDRPPRLDDPDKLSRMVAWLRLRPGAKLESMSLSWAGINALEIDQRKTISATVVGQSDGSPDQVIKLPWQAIDPASLIVQVEELDRGYALWHRVDDLALVGRDDAAYKLDSEAQTLLFGNGLFGRIPDVGRRIRVAHARAGGGSNGNLPRGSLTAISAVDLDGARINRQIIVYQAIATDGGIDAETLPEAERRIPSRLKTRNRSVTEEDYQILAAQTPGVRLGRVEVLPKFVPQQRRGGVPGVVSVMLWPHREKVEAPNPRADRPLLEKVYKYLDSRRPLATELYVVAGEYIVIGLSIAISIRQGFGHDQVTRDVREAIKAYLWSLSPGGPQGEGWPLGRAVSDREIEVIAARVTGVRTVKGVNLFKRVDGNWQQVPREGSCGPSIISLEVWQLPELLAVVVTTGSEAGSSLNGGLGGGSSQGEDGVAVPVIPEVC